MMFLRKQWKLILNIFIIANVLGQDGLDFDKTGLDKLEFQKIRRDQKIKRINIPQLEFKWAKENIEALKKRGTQKLLLKEGTILHSLDDSATYRIPRDLVALSLKGYDENGWAYLINTDKKIRYKTYWKHVIPIREVSDLRLPPKRFKKVSQKDLRKEKTVEKIGYFHELSLLVFNRSSKHLQNIANENIDATFGNGLSYQIFFDLNFPVYLGAGLEYLRGTTSGATKDFTLQQINLGPVANIKTGTLFGRKTFLQIGAMFSMIDRTTTNFTSDYITYNTQSFSIGQRAYYPTRYGDLLLGLSYSREWINAKSETLPSDATDELAQDSKFTFNIGGSW